MVDLWKGFCTFQTLTVVTNISLWTFFFYLHQTLATKLEEHVWIPVNAEALWFHFSGSRTNSPGSLLLVHSAFRQLVFCWHPPDPNTSVRLPESLMWFFTPHNTSPTAPESTESVFALLELNFRWVVNVSALCGPVLGACVFLLTQRSSCYRQNLLKMYVSTDFTAVCLILCTC